MSLLQRVEDYTQDMIETLKSLIAIPSIKDLPADNAPFGREIGRSLESVLTWGEAEGFRAENLSGYAGDLEFGAGDETVGVLLHLDVVPPGDGWTYSPFSGVLEDGRIYGRGAVDDKGPAVAVMYALKALKDENIRLKRKVRLIFGCDEESGWACMEHYFQQKKRPDFGFAPDGDFPLINCEKGLMGIVLRGEPPTGSDSEPQIKWIKGGTRRNIVPDSAEAALTVTSPSLRSSLLHRLQELAKETPWISVSEMKDQVIIGAKGKSAHGSTPDQGKNAIIRLARFLTSLEIRGRLWDLIQFIAEKIGADTDGSGLGIASRDEVSGALTMNLGVVEISQDSIRMELDIRYPLCSKDSQLLSIIEEKTRPFGLAPSASHILPPHYLSVDHPLIRSLLQVYQGETGDYSAPLSIGGRTYAMTLGNAVAFGPRFPGRPELAHQKDEYISVADLKSCARIYAQTLYRLATE